MFLSFAISAVSSASSVRILSRSRPVRRCSCMSRIACAWISERPKFVVRPTFASGGVFDAANQRDHRVEMIERDAQAVENVRARFGLSQLEFDAAADHLAAEVDEELNDFDQAEHPRAPRHDRQRDDAEGLLQLGVLVEIVQHHLADFAALQLDDDAHAVAIRLVAQVGDAVDRLFAHQLRDALEQAGLVQLIGDLVDDDLLAIAFLRRFDFRLRADLDGAAAGEERFVDAAPADDLPAGGEVGTRDQPDQFLEFLLARVGGRIGRRAISVCSMSQTTPSITSPRLCGGMLVAMPTAMPVEPFTRRLG